MARFAASFRAAGAGKFGKPCARLIPPWTCTSRVISRITDSVKPSVRSASSRFAVRISALGSAPSIAEPQVDAVQQRLAGLEAAQVLLDERDRRSEEHTSELQSLAYLVC